MNDTDNVDIADQVAVEEAPVSDRPEWLPEKFSTPEDMAASYSSLESKLGQGESELRSQIEQEMQTSALEGRPETAGDYVLPDIIDEEQAVDNEMLAWWADHAHENGYSQEEFSDGIAKYAEHMASQGPDLETEKRSLGENAEARIEAVDLWANKFFPEEYSDQIELLGQSAQGIKMLEHFMKQSQQSTPAGQFQAPVSTTQDDLDTMMKDPRYWNPAKRDPAYVKSVQDGFSKLYK
tara:strand:- start:906 stop:1616 length:711 start_codon:yes stop_codon:yes gene_type:complete